MSSIIERSESRLYFTQPLPRDSRVYEKSDSKYWLHCAEMAGLLEGSLHMPLSKGTMSKNNMIKFQNLLTLLSFGKENFPFIAYFQANENRTELLDVGLIHDVFLHPENSTEIIEMPTFSYVNENPITNVLQVRKLAIETFGKEIHTITPEGALSIGRSDEHNGCFPGVFAIAGTAQGAGLVTGRLLRGDYPPIQTAQAMIAARNASMPRR